MTIEDDATERTGTFGGNSKATATVVYTHRGSYAKNETLDLPAFEESGGGKLATTTHTNHNGTTKSEDLDTTYTLHVGTIQISSEDTTYAVGWSESGIDTAGQDFYTGEVSTETVSARGNTGSLVDVEDGVITIITFAVALAEEEGGAPTSSRSTETNTYNKWDYRAKDDYFERLDEASQSTVTTVNGFDEEGNSSLSQSIVNEREGDFYSQLTDEEDNGEYGWWKYVTTERRQEQERDAQLATSSGPDGERTQTLAIDNYFWSLTENEEREEELILDPEESGYWNYSNDRDVTRTGQENTSQYSSSHQVNSAGLAYDGSFSASSSAVSLTSVLDADYNYTYDPGEVYDSESLTDDRIVDETTVVRNTSESGGYYDAPYRVQWGNYTITDTVSINAPSDYYTEENRIEEGEYAEEWIVDTKYRYRDASHVVTTGSYGSGGISESQDLTRTLADNYVTHDTRTDSHDIWGRYNKNVSSHNGEFNGHEYRRHWLRQPDGSWLELTSWTVDEDLFGGTPPSGPVAVGTEQLDSAIEALDQMLEIIVDFKSHIRQEIEPNWIVGLRAGASHVWETVKTWDNDEWDTHTQNLENAGYGSTSAWVIGWLGAVGERGGAGDLEDAISGRSATGEKLGVGQRIFRGTVGTAQIALTAVGMKGAATGVKAGVKEGIKLVEKGVDDLVEWLARQSRRSADEAAEESAEQAAKFAEPKVVVPEEVVPEEVTVGSLVPSGSKRLGDWGEARLKDLLGGAGEEQVGFSTIWGWREIDRLVDGIAHESKAGVNVGLSDDIVNQILKDKDLIDTDVIEGAHWHFWQGADQDLLDFLDLQEIPYTLH